MPGLLRLRLFGFGTSYSWFRVSLAALCVPLLACLAAFAAFLVLLRDRRSQVSAEESAEEFVEKPAVAPLTSPRLLLLLMLLIRSPCHGNRHTTRLRDLHLQQVYPLLLVSVAPFLTSPRMLLLLMLLTRSPCHGNRHTTRLRDLHLQQQMLPRKNNPLRMGSPPRSAVTRTLVLPRLVPLPGPSMGGVSHRRGFNKRLKTKKTIRFAKLQVFKHSSFLISNFQVFEGFFKLLVFQFFDFSKILSI